MAAGASSTGAMVLAPVFSRSEFELSRGTVFESLTELASSTGATDMLFQSKTDSVESTLEGETRRGRVDVEGNKEGAFVRMKHRACWPRRPTVLSRSSTPQKHV